PHHRQPRADDAVVRADRGPRDSADPVALMSTSTPPLTWLRAFESAARLGSLKDAAAELSVSPSTISHHVRDLEARLGVPLFAKQGRGLTLTEEGERYFSTLRPAFELLRTSTAQESEAPRRLRIGCFPFLANEVIVPRLDE